MSILGTILIGLIAGALAKLIMPGKDGGGWVMTILLGIAGSVVASYIGSAMGWYIQCDTAGLIASTLGAILILFVYRLFKKKSA